uniref:Uncharacterized protein n=1 Tax=Romanomermis culicivorax TaxID=13658 RepID=A0A915JDF9_ROMCU
MYNKPQKSRKHKKIKAIDPFNVKALEERKKQNTKNLPPKNDEQEVPRAFKELLLMGQQMDKASTDKAGKRKTKRNKKEEDDEFVKHKWENEQQFLNRINRETSNFVNEQLLKIKYDIQEKLQDDSDEGDSDEDYNVQNSTIRKETKLLNSIVIKDSTSNQKGTIPKKKRKKRKNQADPLKMTDFVAFGERNDNPPNLTPFIGKLSKKQPTEKLNLKSWDKARKHLFTSVLKYKTRKKFSRFAPEER